MKAKVNLKNIWSYIQGNTRYFFYYKPKLKHIFIRPHILEQIDVRTSSMDRKCYEDGQCKLCGCKTTALQMANKACDKPCYPSMMGRRVWKNIKEGFFLKEKGLYWYLEDSKFKNKK